MGAQLTRKIANGSILFVRVFANAIVSVNLVRINAAILMTLSFVHIQAVEPIFGQHGWHQFNNQRPASSIRLGRYRIVSTGDGASHDDNELIR